MAYETPKLSWSEFFQAMSGIWPGQPKFTEKDYPSFDGKVVLITGASSGAGYETVKSLAGSTNAKIYVFGRNEEKTLNAIKQIEIEVAKDYNKQTTDIHFVKGDLADLTTIKPAVEKFLAIEKRLDLIIHNAGIKEDFTNWKTPQGYEAQLGTNAIGPHLLQKLLDPIFIETAKSNKPNESRVVWVASTAHFHSPKGGLNWDDIQAENEKPGGRQYGQSKAVNAIQALQWPEAHPEASGVVSVSLCPGFLRTGLKKGGIVESLILKLILWDQRYGAYTELFAAFSPEVNTNNNGAYVSSFGKLGKLRADIVEDKENQRKVWKWLDEQVQPYL